MRAPAIGFPILLQDFFAQRLVAQRAASPQTVASYRDTFELLLRFAERRTARPPTDLTLQDLDAPLVLDFLDHLERERGNCPRTRNARLAAVRSFMRYVSLRDPASIAVAQRVLAIPAKRFDRPIVAFLSREEIEALLDAPDRRTWSGRRDAAMFTVLYNTGARVSEVTGLCVGDILLDRHAAVHLHGKGRKERVVPLWTTTVKHLRGWLAQVERTTTAPVFANRDGKRLSRSGVEYRLRMAAAKATQRCASLRGRRVSPHILRHTTAMHLLQAGVDLAVIALWLGHEDPTTTHLYVEADLAMKEAALRRVQEPSPRSSRFQATDPLLAFLDRL